MNETRSSQASWLNQAAWQATVLTGRWERFGQPAAGLEPATGRVIGRVSLADAPRAWAGTGFESRACVLHTAGDRRPGGVHPVEPVMFRGTAPAYTI